MNINPLEDDVAATMQFREVFRLPFKTDPEHRLMLAILEDALLCLTPSTFRARYAAGQKLREETDAWFFGSDSEGLFSFTSICEHLGIDPDYLRDEIRRFRAEGKSIQRDGRTQDGVRTRRSRLHASKPGRASAMRSAA